jgi:predicted DNA-binding protein (MmcQ/YjbR family)
MTGLRSGARFLLAREKSSSTPSRGDFLFRPILAQKGWIGVGLDEAADWLEIEAFIRRSYRLVAPTRLAKLTM